MSQKTISSADTGRLSGMDMDSQQVEEDEDTRNALFEYVVERASRDQTLSREQATTFTRVQHQTGRGNHTEAALVGRRLAELGDEIDSQYQEELDEIVQLTGSPEKGFSMFYDIVRNLFEWDESGGARINVGRIAALLAYCYRLCKAYIQNHLSVGGLMSFVMMVAGWLFKFLVKAKFYDWLERQGGWGQLLAVSTSGWGQHVFLVIGVTSLLVWAFSYFRGR